ncbi:MAG: hypothetical protein SPL13_06200 [Clostridia bacterium]|nr:hypothetical protein [Clostridia bacterium]
MDIKLLKKTDNNCKNPLSDVKTLVSRETRMDNLSPITGFGCVVFLPKSAFKKSDFNALRQNGKNFLPDNFTGILYHNGAIFDNNYGYCIL